jgi:hypothetical protein
LTPVYVQLEIIELAYFLSLLQNANTSSGGGRKINATCVINIIYQFSQPTIDGTKTRRVCLPSLIYCN